MGTKVVSSLMSNTKAPLYIPQNPKEDMATLPPPTSLLPTNLPPPTSLRLPPTMHKAGGCYLFKKNILFIVDQTIIFFKRKKKKKGEFTQKKKKKKKKKS